MTTITRFDEKKYAVGNLASVRWQLDKLTDIRTSIELTPNDEARYESLCRREAVLLGYA
jgi:hypothetical protein